MTKRDFVKRVQHQYKLGDAKLSTTLRVQQHANLPGTTEPIYTDYNIYDTGRYLVKATKYGKIKDIEQKAQSVLQPKVVIKKKRTIQR